MSGKDLYQIYGSVTDFKNFQGNPMPVWEVLPPTIQRAWEAVADAKSSNVQVGEREMALIHHAQNYTANFQFADAPGHNQYILIAKLAEALGIK